MNPPLFHFTEQDVYVIVVGACSLQFSKKGVLMMRILNVIKIDKGTVVTNEGVYNWNFTDNGIDGLLINEKTAEVYKVITTERDENDNVKTITVN